MIEKPNPKVDIIPDNPIYLFVAYQIERGEPKDGKEGLRHMHVFVTFSEAKPFAYVKKLFDETLGPGGDIKVADDNAYFYCTKEPGDDKWPEKNFTVEQKPILIGNMPKNIERVIKKKNTVSTQGKWEEYAEYLKTHTIKELDERDPAFVLKNLKKLEDYTNFKKKELEAFKPTVFWLCGKTGTYKTYGVIKAEKDLFNNRVNKVEFINNFVNNYDETNEAVLIDELRGSTLSYSKLLSLLDWNDGLTPINVKGSKNSVWRPRRIYITSCYRPENIFTKQVDKTDSISQLLRRIDCIIDTTVLSNLKMLDLNTIINQIKIKYEQLNIFPKKSLGKNETKSPSTHTQQNCNNTGSFAVLLNDSNIYSDIIEISDKKNESLLQSIQSQLELSEPVFLYPLTKEDQERISRFVYEEEHTGTEPSDGTECNSGDRSESEGIV